MRSFIHMLKKTSLCSVYNVNLSLSPGIKHIWSETRKDSNWLEPDYTIYSNGTLGS